MSYVLDVHVFLMCKHVDDRDPCSLVEGALGSPNDLECLEKLADELSDKVLAEGRRCSVYINCDRDLLDRIISCIPDIKEPGGVIAKINKILSEIKDVSRSIRNYQHQVLIRLENECGPISGYCSDSYKAIVHELISRADHIRGSYACLNRTLNQEKLRCYTEGRFIIEGLCGSVFVLKNRLAE